MCQNEKKRKTEILKKFEKFEKIEKLKNEKC